MGDGDFVQLEQAFRLGQPLADEHGIEAFEIGEDDKLLKRRVIADISIGVGMGIAPLLRGPAEEGDVEQVGFVRIDELRLSFGDRGWEKRLLDGVGVDAVINFGQGALEVPAEFEPVVFVVLEPLEFGDEVELEFRAEPRSELEGNILVGVGASVTSGTGDQSNSSCQLDLLFCRHEKTIPARLISNSLEFEGIKTGVVDTFPDAEEQDGVFILEPLLDQRARSIEVPHQMKSGTGSPFESPKAIRFPDFHVIFLWNRRLRSLI